MRLRNEARTALVLTLTAGLTLTACQKDAAYDALTEDNGIDMTVTIANGGLTIPFGSTDKIMLTELIDPADSEVIETDANGNYKLTKEGTLDPSSFNVKAVSISADPSITAQSFSFDVPDSNISDAKILSYLKADSEVGMTLEQVIDNAIIKAIDEALDDYRDELQNAGLSVAEITSIIEERKDDITAEVKANITIPVSFTASCDDLTFNTDANFPLKANNVDDDLVDIVSMYFNSQNSGMGLKLAITGLPETEGPSSISIDQFVIEMPQYVVLSGDEVPSSAENTINTTKQIAISDGKAEVSLDFALKALLFDENDPLPNVNGTINRQDPISVMGSASIKDAKIRTNNIVVREKNGEKVLGLKNDLLITPSITPFSTTIDQIFGHFNPEIKPIDTNVNINLGDDLDFLERDDVRLDLKNPQITIDLENNCAIRMTSVITLTSDKGKTIQFTDVNMTSSTSENLKIVLAAEYPSDDYVLPTDGSEYWYTNPDLHTFLEPVPGNIDVHIDVTPDTRGTYPLELGKDISVSGKYYVSAPLEFRNIHISYDETVEDVFDEDITDLLSSINNAVLSFSAESSVPLDLKVVILAKDKQGNERTDLVKFTANDIKAGSLQTPASTNVTCELTIADVAAVKDLIIRIEGDGKDCSLNGNQYLKLSDARIKINKLNVDLNDK